MERIEVNGTVLNLRIDRVGDATPWIVFGNSLVTDLSIWEAQVDALARRWNILRYDQRGHGGSTPPASETDFDTLSADLLALLDHVGIGRCVYVGLSMGVPTGLGAVQKTPERFCGLVLVDGQARSAPTAVETWGERISVARRQGMGEFGRVTAARWLTPSTTPNRRAHLAGMIGATPFEGFAACASALKSYDYAVVLPQIGVPTLLIAGEEDGQMPSTMQAMAATIPGAALEVIESAGHVPCFEQPDAFNALLLAFLKQYEVGA